MNKLFRVSRNDWLNGVYLTLILITSDSMRVLFINKIIFMLPKNIEFLNV